MSARDRRDKAEMRTEDVLTSRPTVLTEAQRAAYFSDGFLILPDYVPRTWLERLCAANDELLERSRRVVHPDSIFVLEERHSAQHPRLHRVSSPQDQHPTFWDFMCDPIMTDLAADVVGPDVKFHHAKLNVKSERGHTRVQVASGHPDEVAASIPADMVATATGGPGTTVLLNCRTIHGSGENRSDRARPLLLPVYSSADSFPYTVSPIVSPRLGDIVRGHPARFACFDTRPCELPPDFRAGYNPPWLAQRDEENRAGTLLRM
jgi:ectoine hydroxylase